MPKIAKSKLLSFALALLVFLQNIVYPWISILPAPPPAYAQESPPLVATNSATTPAPSPLDPLLDLDTIFPSTQSAETIPPEVIPEATQSALPEVIPETSISTPSAVPSSTPSATPQSVAETPSEVPPKTQDEVGPSPTPTSTPATQTTDQADSPASRIADSPNIDISPFLLTLAYPFKGSYPISYGFGEVSTSRYVRLMQSIFSVEAHDGLDFAMPEGTPILATDVGRVVSAGNGLYGLTVIIEHSWGLSYYGHLSQITLTKDQVVAKGEHLGLSGSSGISTGPHLHFGIRPNHPNLANGYHGMVNPLPYLLGQVLGDSDSPTTTNTPSTRRSKFRLPKQTLKTSDTSLPLEFTTPQGSDLQITLTDPSETTTNITQAVLGDTLGPIAPKLNLDVSILPITEPGEYTLTIADSSGVFDEQTFAWGVLAMNPNQAVYRPRETAQFAFAVLDTHGEMVCDADLILTITNPLGLQDQISTTTGEIQVNESVCMSKDFTLTPDYTGAYTLNDSGEYSLHLTATTDNGTYEIDDSITVSSTELFYVERKTITRVYPLHTYPVTLRITPQSDYQGLVTETIPSNFVTSDPLTWEVDWQAGQTYELNYTFDAPDLSPAFYTLGPLTIGNNFTENRPWQLAIDSVNIFPVTTSTTGSGTNQSSFSHTVATGPNRLLVVAISTEDTTDADRVVSSVTWNTSEALTSARNQQNDTDNVGANIYYLINPTATTANVVVNFAGAVTSIGVTVMNLYNAAQSSVVDVANGSNQSNTATPNLSATTGSNYSFVVSAITNNANTALTSTQTERSDFTLPTTAARMVTSTIQTDVAGSQNMGYTAGGATNDYAQAIVAFKTTTSVHTLGLPTTSTAGSGTNQSSFSYTVPSTDLNRVLVVAISTEDATDADRVVSSVTWNTSESLTSARNQQNDTSNVGANIYYLANPTATTANVVVNFAGTVTSIGVTVMALSNVDIDAALDANNGANQDNTATPNVSLTTATNGAFIVSVNTNNVNTALTSTQDERADFTLPTTAARSIVSTRTGDTAGSHNMGYTAGAATNDHAQAVASFKLAPTTISITGIANGNDGGTVKVAVGSSVQAQTTTIGSGTWTITGITPPSANDILTVWVDGVTDGNETTATTKYVFGGNITGMVLDTNVVTIGSNQNGSLSLTNLDTYDCTDDEDIMYQAGSSHLKVEGDSCAGSTSNSYSAEELEILSGDTLTVATAETLTTYDLTISGTLTSSGNSTYNIARNWANSGTFTSGTSTVNLTGADSSTQTLSGSTSFNNLTISTSSNSAGRTITHTAGTTQTVTGTWTVTGYSGKVITLGSSTTSAWTINPTAASVTYTSVSYSTNSGSVFCATNSTNGGNNTGWTIVTDTNCPVNGSTASSFQRKTWHDGTRYWRSFLDTDDNRIEFEYSSDGTSWTENTGARISVDSADFSVWADSSNAFISYTNGFDIESREASTYPSTSFTWGSATVTYNGTSASDYYQYPTLALDSGNKIWVSASYQSSTVINSQVSANDEDAEEQMSGSGFTVTPLDNKLHVQSHEFDSAMAAAYFPNITVPSGSTITSAYTEINISSTSQDDCHIEIYGNDVDNANDFTTEADVLTRTPTTSFTSITQDAVGTGWFGSAHSLVSVIQEIVDRGGWSSGNAISLLYVSKSWASVGTKECWFADYNGSAANAPKLHVEYSTSQIVASRSTSALDITTWDTASVLDDATDPSNLYSTIVPRTSSGAYAVWIDGTTIEGKNYNGTSWDGSPTTIDTGLTGLADTFSAVSDSSGNVYLLYISDEATDQVSHSKFNGTSWSSAALVADAASANDSYPTLTLDTTGSNLYAFWIDTSTSDLYYSSCATSSNCDTAGEWSAETAWVTTGTNTYVTSNYSGAGLIFAQWSDTGTIAWDRLVSNLAPDDPTSLAQLTTSDVTIATGDWVSATSIKFSVTASDSDSSDTLYLCIEKDLLGDSFSNTEDSCGSGMAYSGSPVSVTHTISSQTDASEYHWQARLKDTAGEYSGWISYGGNAESARDYGLDTTAPTGGTVYDGTSAGNDAIFSDSSLSVLSGNWDSFSSAASGLNKYQYSIGTTAGATDIKAWTDNSTTTNVTATGLTLQTNQLYFFNVRAVDNAGNTGSPVSSNGQLVAPSISFALDSPTLAFDTIIPSGNDTATTTLTTSTNAYNGYVIRAFITDYLRSEDGNHILTDFTGGTYASPAVWGGSDTGFGYTSSDTTIQGSNKFSSGTLYAPFSQVGPGDIVADHTTAVSGTPVSVEQFTITAKVQATSTQPAGTYGTTIIYTATAQY